MHTVVVEEIVSGKPFFWVFEIGDVDVSEQLEFAVGVESEFLLQLVLLGGDALHLLLYLGTAVLLYLDLIVHLFVLVLKDCHPLTYASLLQLCSFLLFPKRNLNATHLSLWHCQTLSQFLQLLNQGRVAGVFDDSGLFFHFWFRPAFLDRSCWRGLNLLKNWFDCCDSGECWYELNLIDLKINDWKFVEIVRKIIVFYPNAAKRILHYPTYFSPVKRLQSGNKSWSIFRSLQQSL